MVEVFGILVALVLAGAAWSAWRVFRAARAILGDWRRAATSPAGTMKARRLRASRAQAQAQALRLETLTLELGRARALRRLAERERDLLRARQGPGDDRFPRAKRAFALRFHPDRVAARGAEGAIRRALFQEYWIILQRIERG